MLVINAAQTNDKHNYLCLSLVCAALSFGFKVSFDNNMENNMGWNLAEFTSAKA
jgi:hypothetical protein